MPVPRIADCGRNTTGVSNSAPRDPVFVSVNVPPESSSGFSWLLRVRVGEVGDLRGEPGEVEVAGVADHRGEQAALGVDGDADVLVAG